MQLCISKEYVQSECLGILVGHLSCHGVYGDALNPKLNHEP